MTSFRRSRLFLPLSILSDTLCLNAAFIIAYYMRFKEVDTIFQPPYELFFWIFNATWFLLLLIIKPYKEPRVTFNIFSLLYNFIILLAVHTAIIACFWAFSKGYEYSRLHIGMTYLLALFFGTFVRFVGILILKQFRKYGYNLRNYIIVGYGELSSTIVTYYEKYPVMGYAFNGFFGETKTDKVIGTYDEVKDFLINNKIDYVYCCVPYLDNQNLAEIIKFSEMNQAQVKLLMDFRGFLDKGVSIEYHDHLPIINVSTKPFLDYRTAILKRVFDIGFTSLVMLLGSPIFLLVMLITKLTSKGPVFYKSERIGLWGEKFFMYKFRSMYADASSRKHIVLSTGTDDPRITPWGKIMRKTRLDELPQFINVFTGDMSVVGPRPGIPRYNEEVIKIAPEFEKLLAIKPGVTSLGQINYGYAETPEEMVDRMRFDLQYLDRYSLRTDLWLIFKTAQIMIQGKGQ
jgi:exopolysaccharide biosynthesis polyprenyl glycosylphosphotransferase